MTAKIKLNAASGGGSVSIQGPSNTSNDRVFTLPDSADATLLTSTSSVGKILQIVSTQKSDVFTWSSDGDVAITGMSVAITPSSSSNKVLITVQIGASGMYNDAYPMFFQLYKGGSAISGAKGSGSAGASDPVKCASYSKNYVYYTGTSTSFSFIDSPATTSATTYALYAQRHTSGGTGYFNATGRQINERYAETISTITAMEVAA